MPAGSSDGGQWTDGTADGTADLGLFRITPSDSTLDSVQLAGELPVGDTPEIPTEEPPEIPQEKPGTSAARTGFMRAAINWLARNAGIAGDLFTGAMNNVEWLNDRQDLIQAARDEPKTLEELQAGVGQARPGYDDHHIVEKTWAEYFGFAKSRIDDPSNLVSIPRLMHYQITGWYMTPNER